MKAPDAIKILQNIQKMIPHRYLTLQTKNGETGKWEIIGWDTENRWLVAFPLDKPDDNFPIKMIAAKLNQIIAEKERHYETMAKARAARGGTGAGHKTSSVSA